jgi:D-alanine-D-alanine ligase
MRAPGGDAGGSGGGLGENGKQLPAHEALLRDAGIPTPRSLALAAPPVDGARPPFDAPFFVKPANGGSSVGVAKVKRAEDYRAAVENALRYDERALVEEGIDARELECAGLGNAAARASIVGEIVPGHEFYDYDDKYRDDTAKLVIPAAVSDAVAAEVRRLSVEVFRLCGVSGMARVDFFLNKDTGEWFVNEANTIPGFTSISMYPKMWEASGIPYRELLTRLVELALARHERRAALTRDFHS